MYYKYTLHSMSNSLCMYLSVNNFYCKERTNKPTHGYFLISKVQYLTSYCLYLVTSFHSFSRSSTWFPSWCNRNWICFYHRFFSSRQSSIPPNWTVGGHSLSGSDSGCIEDSGLFGGPTIPWGLELNRTWHIQFVQYSALWYKIGLAKWVEWLPTGKGKTTRRRTGRRARGIIIGQRDRYTNSGVYKWKIG